MNKPWLVLLLLVLLSPALPAADRALLVGIDAYRHVSPLKGSKTDTESMHRFLQEVWRYPPDDIRVLLDAEATRDNILRTFDEWLIQGTGPGDRVFFHYSGHGYFIPDQPGGDEGGDGKDEVLVPVDGAITETGPRNMIRDDEINRRLARLVDRQVVVVVDSCHSGTITRGDLVAEGLARTPTGFDLSPEETIMSRGELLEHQTSGAFVDSRPGLIAFSAVAANQKALVDMEARPLAGVFTRRFVAGVAENRADADGDGRVIYAELLDWLRRESEAYCQRHAKACREGLTPQLEADPQVLSWEVRSHRPLDGPRPESLLAHDNQAGVQLVVLPGRRVRLGREMRFRVSARRPGQVLLFDLDPKGRLTPLLPNPYGAGRLRPGGTLLVPGDEMPFRYQAAEPVGRGRVVAVLVEDPGDILRDIMVESQGLETVADPQDWLNRLRRHLNQTYHQSDGTNRALRWSTTSQVYEIVP